MNFSIIGLKIKEAILYISYVLKHYSEVYSFLKPAERNNSGLPKFKYLLFSNLYHTSWVTKRKVMIMMKEENVEVQMHDPGSRNCAMFVHYICTQYQ